MAVFPAKACLLGVCVATIALRATATVPGPPAPPSPGLDNGRSLDVVVGSSDTYLEVKSVEDIAETCRDKYVTDGIVSVPIVGVAVKLISIISLDMAESTFKADFNINVAWVGDATDGPEIQIYNMVEEIEREQQPKPTEEGLQVGKNGSDDGVTKWSFYYRVRVRGVFRQVYQLARFPFDTQQLRIDVRMKSECQLVPLRWGTDGSAFSYDDRAVHDEFSIVGAHIEHAYLPGFKFGRLNGYDPEVRIIISVLRKPLYWVVSYGAVTSALSTLMVCTYAVDSGSVDGRLGIAMTLVLTMVATVYLMQEKLPHVSYATLLDFHICICCLVLMALTMEIGVRDVSLIKRFIPSEEQWLPYVGSLWVVYHCCIIAWIGTQQLG